MNLSLKTISSKTTAHCVCSDAQKTRARFKGVMWNSIVQHPDIYKWCFGIGILICALSLLLLYRKIHFLISSENTKGEVIRINKTEESCEDPLFFPVIEFIDLNGSKRVFNSRVGRSYSAFNIGDIINIRYNPKSPDKAYIVSVTELFFVEIILLILGLGWAILSFKNI